jgi:hypothetical protein
LIRVLVCWDLEEEIEKASTISSKIHELLDKEGLHSGTSTVNDPPKTFGLDIKE